MTDRMLPLLGEPAHERSDAARNRVALLVAARALVQRCGVAGVTMEAVAAEAGVGKGTVFRRFESRAGLEAYYLFPHALAVLGPGGTRVSAASRCHGVRRAAARRARPASR